MFDSKIFDFKLIVPLVLEENILVTKGTFCRELSRGIHDANGYPFFRSQSL